MSRLVSALAAASIAVCSIVLLAGCASTTPEAAAEDAPVRAPDVAASQIAHDLGLVASTSPGRVTLDSTGSARILLFPGTRVASVGGRTLDLGEPATESGGEVWITADDAGRIRATWAVVVANGADLAPSATWSGAGHVPIPASPRPSQSPAIPSRPGSPSAAANVASAAERAAWSVPLRRAWRYIVVHHSASAAGNAAAIDQWHKDRGFDGLGYDFVIGNGTASGDGAIEVGYRWRQQLVGAHAKTAGNLMNEQGIGICLVGDFSRTRPTAAQMRSLERLCAFLAGYCAIPATNLRMHGEVKSTECPGRYFPRDFEIRMAAILDADSPRAASHTATR